MQGTPTCLPPPSHPPFPPPPPLLPPPHRELFSRRRVDAREARRCREPPESRRRSTHRGIAQALPGELVRRFPRPTDGQIEQPGVLPSNARRHTGHTISQDRACLTLARNLALLDTCNFRQLCVPAEGIYMLRNMNVYVQGVFVFAGFLVRVADAANSHRLTRTRATIEVALLGKNVF